MGHLGIRANLPALSDFVAAYIAGLHGRVLMMESTEMAHGASKEVDGGDNLVSECGFHFCYSGHVQAHNLSCICRGSTGQAFFDSLQNSPLAIFKWKLKIFFFLVFDDFFFHRIPFNKHLITTEYHLINIE